MKWEVQFTPDVASILGSARASCAYASPARTDGALAIANLVLAPNTLRHFGEGSEMCTRGSARSPNE